MAASQLLQSAPIASLAASFVARGHGVPNERYGASFGATLAVSAAGCPALVAIAPQQGDAQPTAGRRAPRRVDVANCSVYGAIADLRGARPVVLIAARGKRSIAWRILPAGSRVASRNSAPLRAQRRCVCVRRGGGASAHARQHIQRRTIASCGRGHSCCDDESIGGTVKHGRGTGHGVGRRTARAVTCGRDPMQPVAATARVCALVGSGLRLV